jgi:hypothetical protein
MGALLKLLLLGLLIMHDLSVIFFGDHKAVGRSQMMISALPANINIISKSTYPEILPFFFRVFLALLHSKKILFLNRKAALVYLIYWPMIYFICKASHLHVIYDMWELYTIKEHKKIISRIGTLIEIFVIKHVDQVIVCNDYRNKLVRRLYKIKNVYTIENIRSLPKNCRQSYDLNTINFCDYNKSIKKFVITNGFSRERGDLALIDAFLKCDNCSLTFIGDSTFADEIFLNDLMLKKNLHNIKFLKSIRYSDLACVVKLFDFGVVNYSRKNLNNRFCASGKIYEFIFLGLPVLSSSNPSLKKIVDFYQCGESSDDFVDAISRCISKSNVYRSALNSIDVDRLLIKHNKNIINCILK